MEYILVPSAINTPKENPLGAYHFIRDSYAKRMVALSLFPLVVPAVTTQEMWDDAYKRCAGVLLMGGTDADPRLFNQSKHEATNIAEPERDIIELYIARKALADKKPILSICRGAQMLAIAAGGTLHQHIPDINTEETHNTCTVYEDLVKPECQHDIYIEKNSRAHTLLGKDTVNINSAHHQSIDNPGINMRISGKSKAGITELIEHTDPEYFCFGIQGHPEVFENSPWRSFFENFAKAVRKQ